MKFSIEKSLKDICNNAISSFSAYKSNLDNEKATDQKALTARHYVFLSNTMHLGEKLDDTIITITNGLKYAESINNVSDVCAFTELFEKSIILKGIIDEYYSHSDDALNQDRALTNLKNLTEIALRKIINFNTTQLPPTL